LKISFLELLKDITQCASGWERNPFRKTCIKSFSGGSEEIARSNCAKMGGALAILNTAESLDWFMEVRQEHEGDLCASYLT